jgi:hypothetical protein
MIRTRLFAVAVVVMALMFSTLACCCGVPEAVQEGFGMDWPWSGPVVRGSGNVIEVSRDEQGFSGISLRGSSRLVVDQGDTESVVIQAEDNVIPYLETRVEGSLLVIGTKPGTILRPTRPIIFRVTVRNLDHLQVSGSGDAEGAGLEVGRLLISVSGSGSVDLADLEAESVEGRVSGSGTIDLAGSARSQDLVISGSGDYRARGVQSVEADVRVSGSGSATLSVTERLDVTITGSGSVRYAGDPTVRSSVTGSGTIQQIGE